MSEGTDPVKFDFRTKTGVIKAEETIAEYSIGQKIPIQNIMGAQRAVNGRMRVEEIHLRYLALIKPNKGTDWEPPTMPLLEG